MANVKSAITPMMAQFLEIKAEYPQALLFYRMGDFYEMFFDDAVAAAEALDIALTKRGKHMDQDIPMCGVPVHSAEGYLLTLIRKGFRVAVCEQMEDPAEAKKRGSKSVVKRGVVRLVTPGTLTEDSLLEARRNNFLCAYAQVRGDGALAWVDISTGQFRVAPCPLVRLGPELARLTPREILIADSDDNTLFDIITESGAAPTPLSRASFDSTSGEKRLCALFGVSSLDAFATFSRAEIAAMAAIVDYLEITQKGKLPLLRPPIRESADRVMQIDAATRRNLELTHALSGGRDGSLLAAIDRTLTAGGGRLLERRLSSPSRHLPTIDMRLNAVGFLVEQSRMAEDLRAALRRVPDMDRALSRLALDRGGPRDLTAMRAGLERARDIAQMAHEDMPPLLGDACQALHGHDDLIALLDQALIAEPPLLLRDGGFIAKGYDAELDEARTLRDEGRSVIAGLQADYAAQTGISTLKIKHNNVLGYFIETTATHAQKMLSAPLSDTFIHRQTTANAVRFTTVPLNDMETKILNAGARALEIEKRLYSSLTQAILAESGEISATAAALAELDLSAALADLARGEDWARPKMDDSRAFLITGGRHPVVEQALRRQGTASFVANDCALAEPDSEAAIWLLTGPNMAGKSTFLRQNALIALLAQMGSFVPATTAHIGIVSQLFSRVGAADDLARGRSTFMVEMVETAAILNQADDRALVILDEIGRGTATYDGLSIAWATMEHLHDKNRCRALFATHYHEMTQLADRLTGAQNATVTVKEWQGDVVFLHEVRKGSADRSYGVQVARLAGLPQAVVDRAKVVLDALEKGEREGGARKAALIDDLPLFSAVATAAPAPTKPSPVMEKIAQVHPDDLSPKQALNLIYELKALTTSGSS
ncbi:DNA mismatch repair protein MutS [Oceaniglobus ichthyenteri]|uniref:DNA mismatch repair protein MutS n=1 Tax=Oceaniglobus ichthyenteri TaxID=2136177 RepID=UPI001F0C5C21|nr:DNA mismatch repair protein MutS [Oceaniglobus ichthyenteri]